MTLEQLLKEKRAEIIETAARHGASNVRVFGSVARGEAAPDSDIDFLVTFERGRSLFDHARLIFDLAELLGCDVDVASDRGLKERIRKRVLDEAISI